METVIMSSCVCTRGKGEKDNENYRRVLPMRIEQ